jgi:hypothetical protein
VRRAEHAVGALRGRERGDGRRARGDDEQRFEHHERVQRDVDQRVERDVDQRIEQLVHERVEQLVHERVEQLVHERVEQLFHDRVEQLFHERVEQLFHERVEQLFHERVEQLVQRQPLPADRLRGVQRRHARGLRRCRGLPEHRRVLRRLDGAGGAHDVRAHLRAGLRQLQPQSVGDGVQRHRSLRGGVPRVRRPG